MAESSAAAADTPTLDFERPVVALERKIDELVRVSGGASELRPQIAAAGGAGARAAAEDLRGADALAEGAALPPPGAPVHAGLHRAAVRGLHRAARRPPFRRRPGRGRRLRHLRRHARPGARAPEGAQHEGEGAAQLRPAQARGLPQGAAPDGAGRAHAPADHLPDRHAGRLPRRRRRGARPGRGDREEPGGDGGPAGSDRLRRDRRGRLGRRARARRRATGS